ncbi:MAG: LamG-like jellyroll fold domain-containing protein [Polyangiaceae bacterium]
MRRAALIACLVCTACFEIAEAEPPATGGGAGQAGTAGGSGFPGGGSGGSGGGSSGGGAAGVATNGGATAFLPRGVVFDGIEDYLDSVNPFDNTTDTTKVSGSMWFRRSGLSTLYCIGPEGAGSNQPNQLEWTADNRFRIAWRQTNGGIACDLQSDPIVDTTAWHHILFSVDTLAGKAHLYVDGASQLNQVTLNQATLDVTASRWGLFGTDWGASKYQGEAAEFWLAPGIFLDFSLPANRAKFRTAAGKPVDLNIDGAAPIGAQPAIYLTVRDNEAPGAFAANRGYAGGFKTFGGLDYASTSPGAP